MISRNERSLASVAGVRWSGPSTMAMASRDPQQDRRAAAIPGQPRLGPVVEEAVRLRGAAAERALGQLHIAVGCARLGAAGMVLDTPCVQARQQRRRGTTPGGRLRSVQKSKGSRRVTAEPAVGDGRVEGAAGDEIHRAQRPVAGLCRERVCEREIRLGVTVVVQPIGDVAGDDRRFSRR